MKRIYSEMPESLKGTYADYSRNFGFSWKEFVATVPSPLFLVTTYKSNGLPNACMQSWAAFTSADHGKGFYAILASVNKRGHLYEAPHYTVHWDAQNDEFRHPAEQSCFGAEQAYSVYRRLASQCTK